MIELALSNGHPVQFKTAPFKKFKGVRLADASLFHSSGPEWEIFMQEYAQSKFGLSLRYFSCDTEQHFIVRESSLYIRIEAIIQGELSYTDHKGNSFKLKTGQYRIADGQAYNATISGEHALIYLAIFLSPVLIGENLIPENIKAGPVLMMTPEMHRIIQRVTDNIYEEKLRDAFYDHTIREILFHHNLGANQTMPGELSPEELAKVYEADNIIAADLSRHYTTQQLAKMVHTNAQVLKAGFSRVYGMGTFERLLQRKMERAKHLLESSNKQIQQIAVLAGYETVTGFINAFRRQFKMPPKDWRKKSRGLL